MLPETDAYLLELIAMFIKFIPYRDHGEVARRAKEIYEKHRKANGLD